MVEGWGTPAEVEKPLSTPSGPTAGWGSPDEPKPIDTSGPMPGPLDAAWAGVKHSISGVEQSAETLEGKQPTPVAPDTSPAASSFELRDILEPTRGLSKVAYRTGASSPTIAGGVLGGIGGSAVAGPVGTAIG